MALRAVPFAAHSYQDRSLPVSAQRLVNLYLEKKPDESKGPVALHSAPGTVLWANIGDGPIRGMKRMGDLLYVVSGEELYRVTERGVATLAGQVKGSAQCQMAYNGTQMIVASDYFAYFATEGTFGQITFPQTNGVVGVTVQDGYAIFGYTGTQTLIVSQINDVSAALDATEFVLVNALPDNIVAVQNANRETWVFGENSTQIYYNSGQLDFPFSPVPSGVIQRGCAAKRSVAEFQGNLFWLGDDLRVYRSNGHSAVPISTIPMDREIFGYKSPSGAVAFAYQQEGHVFYVLTFDNATWVFDITIGIWHERQSDGIGNWRARSHERFAGRLLVGDAVNGNVNYLSLDTFTENGVKRRRSATSAPLHAAGRRAFMRSFQLDLEGSVGLITGQGSDAEVMLDWSDDGGLSFGNELWRSIGSAGNRGNVVKWHRLGQFRQRTMRIAISDSVKTVIIEAYADMVGAAS